jgi:ArsR family transcriptional regulator
MEKELYERHADMCRVFSHPTRLQIINILRDEEMSVTKLANELEVSIGNLSQHLALMKSVHILRARKDGQRIYYSIENPRMLDAFDILRDVLITSIEHETDLVKRL